MPALLLKLELARASGEFAYGGSQVGFPVPHDCYDRTTKHHA
jgi:hypothetical protein